MKEKIKQGGIIAVVVIGLLVVLYGISWIVTTGIWLIICILKSIFSVTVKKD